MQRRIKKATGCARVVYKGIPYDVGDILAMVRTDSYKYDIACAIWGKSVVDSMVNGKVRTDELTTEVKQAVMF
jgi:hypothetical protein